MVLRIRNISARRIITYLSIISVLQLAAILYIFWFLSLKEIKKPPFSDSATLRDICMREGAVAELTCSSYLTGMAMGFIESNDPHSNNICIDLPAAQRDGFKAVREVFARTDSGSISARQQTRFILSVLIENYACAKKVPI